MQRDFASLDRRRILRFFIGDVRDKDRLHRAFQGVDYVIHAAASKIIPTAEYNPFECIKTNVDGAMNVIEAAIDQKVKRVVALSTDKACNPVNLYGATKLCSDKLFVAGNAYVGHPDTAFCVVRYGNVMGSRGSVIPFFQSIAHTGELPVTDRRMTRFMITLDQGVDLVLRALREGVGGEIFVPKIPSMKVVDIAKTIAPKAKLKIVGIRPGEKIHEMMISEEDARTTYEYKDYYKILPAIHDWQYCLRRIGFGKKCSEGFIYSSAINSWWMSPGELKKWIAMEYVSASKKSAARYST
jgi:UDP-N-acetylglucosamine 4,6-dehydratase (inverting)